MKKELLICILSLPVLLTACGTAAVDPATTDNARLTPRKRAAPAHLLTVTDDHGAVAVQKVEFRPGASSTTVERMARNAGCEGEQGAGLVTERGPVEVYRMQCGNGSTYVARCEFRQCMPMRR